MWEISGVEAFHWGTGCQSHFDCTELQTNLSQLSYAHPTVCSTKWKKKFKRTFVLRCVLTMTTKEAEKNQEMLRSQMTVR